MRLISLGPCGLFAKVDDADFERVSAYNWSLLRKRVGHGGPYARTYTNGRHFYLHQFILGQKFVDHRNGDGLDCQRCNIRPATHLQNCANSRRRSNNKSGYKGVSWDTQTKSWIVQIRYGGKKHTLGRFKDIQQAAELYSYKAKALHGEFACLL